MAMMMMAVAVAVVSCLFIGVFVCSQPISTILKNTVSMVKFKIDSVDIDIYWKC